MKIKLENSIGNKTKKILLKHVFLRIFFQFLFLFVAFVLHFRSQHYVGELISGFYDDRIGHLVVGTEENVIAALNVDNGDIIWRRVLEKSDRGSIQYLQLLSEDVYNANSLRVSGRQDPDRFMVTVTGTTFLLVRIWNIRTGNLAWEWNVQISNTPNVKSHWFSTASTIYHIQSDAWNVEITAYDIKTGQIETPTRKIPIGSTENQKCDFVQSFLVCSGSGEITVTDLLQSGTKKVLSKSSTHHTVVNVCPTSSVNKYSAAMTLMKEDELKQLPTFFLSQFIAGPRSHRRN